MSRSWNSIETAPKDGTMILLIVVPHDSAPNIADDNPTEDANLVRTIGFNGLENTGEDHWELAGWSWPQDCFCAGHGTPILWMPLPDLPKTAEVDEWKRDDKVTVYMLALVMDFTLGFEEMVDAVSSWSDTMVRMAEDWAGAVHLKASDNDDVLVPEKPSFLDQYESVEGGAE